MSSYCSYRGLAVLVIILLAYSARDSCVTAQSASNVCSREVTCTACLQASPDCTWCKDEDFSGVERCGVRGSLGSCPLEQIEDPQSAVIDRVETLPSASQQVLPAVINVTTRPGSPVSFNITVRSERNYPLDVYLLLDVSASLSDDLANLRRLSSLLISTLQNISSNYRIGLGTFVDKPTLPFSPAVPALNSFGFCITGVTECVPPYSYRHLLSLTSDTAAYESAINSRTNISYGADRKEGGMDAIMQAVVCNQLIGWRENARHLLLYISDAPSHTAGDGKIAGILTPHDGQCHMAIQDSGDYEYTHWDQLDYPSVKHVGDVLRQQDIIPIFGTVQDTIPVYQRIRDQIPDALVGSIGDDGGDIVNFVQQSYENVSQRIVLRPDNAADGLGFSYTPIAGCNSIQDDGSCFDVQSNEEVVLQVNITLESCAQDSNMRFMIRVPGFGEMLVNLEPICECPCTAAQVVNSSMCRGGLGSLVCGVCSCRHLQDNFRCPVINGEMCSGNGQCDDCGQCQCRKLEADKRIFGEGCECNNFGCPVDPANDLTCGGRGECCNGGCQCMRSNLSGQPFTGSLCTCSPDNHTCIDPQAPMRGVCYGRGECRCGRCECSEDYDMEFCSRCISDSCSHCQLYENCVLCAKGMNTTECRDCAGIATRLVPGNQYDSDVDRLVNPTPCTSVDGNCEHFFHVQEDRLTGQITIIAREDTVCYQDPVPFIIAGATAGGLIVSAIVFLVLFKVVLKLCDLIEYKRFQTETQDYSMVPVQNPLYISPEMEYKNVLYKEGRRRGKGIIMRVS